MSDRRMSSGWGAAARGMAIAAGALLAFAAAGGAQTEVDRVLPIGPGAEVDVELISGSVTVTAGADDELRITGTLGRGVQRLDVDSAGNVVTIEVESRGRGGGGEAHLQIQVPASTRLEVETVSAEVAVSGVDAWVEAATVSGGVRVEGSPERLDAESVSGSVEVVDGARELRVETVSGTIMLRGDYRDLEASTVSGGIDLQSRSVRRAGVESVSGTMRLDLRLEPGADLSAESHSGVVELLVPGDVSAHFAADTFSGRIRNEIGPKPRRTSRYTSEKELRFKAGSGAASVRLETFSGDLRIRVR